MWLNPLLLTDTLYHMALHRPGRAVVGRIARGMVTFA